MLEPHTAAGALIFADKCLATAILVFAGCKTLEDVAKNSEPSFVASVAAFLLWAVLVGAVFL